MRVKGRVGRGSTESNEQRQMGGGVWDGLCVHVGQSLVASEGRPVSIRWSPHLGRSALGGLRSRWKKRRWREPVLGIRSPHVGWELV